MKKALISLMLAGTMMLGFAACASEEGGDTTTTTAAAEQTTTAATTTAAATTTQAEADPTTPEVDSDAVAFTYDVDITITDGNAGLVFQALDNSNFLMWQLAIGEKNDGNLYLRPHTWVSGGAACVEEIKINEVEGLTDITIAYNATYHMTIDVRNNGRIITSVNNVVVWDTESLAGLIENDEVGLVGFRCDAYQGGTIPEAGDFDNLVVKDGTGKVLMNETFDDASSAFATACTTDYPDNITVEGGVMKVTGKVLAMVEIG